jgi:hypothetical protein
MYHISELSEEERKYLFCRESFSEYAVQVEDFSRTDSLSMLRIAAERGGATEPGEVIGVVRAHPTRLHWILSNGQCRWLKVDSRFILSSERFSELMKGSNAKRACRYCIADFLYR